MDGYATHLEPVIVALLNTRPSVIFELGIGDYSTPLIRHYARVNNVSATSAENDEEWIDKINYVPCEHHTIVTWDQFVANILPTEKWQQCDFVFMDNQCPSSRRLAWLQEHAVHVPTIVLHDRHGAVRGHTSYHWNVYGHQATIMSTTINPCFAQSNR
jgi:hypothetical protein